MNEQELYICRPGLDQRNPKTEATERPLKICVVFDDDVSASSAELLISHVASNYECETRTFRFDELDRPTPVVVAARSASSSDILVIAVRENQMLPSHVKSWLGICIGLRDENQEGALVALSTEAAQTSNLGSSLLEYLETIAVIGGLAFFSREQGIDGHLNRARPLRN
jgi:hypothetical protein